MSTIEDRLTHALAARAEQVQPEDLRGLGLPAPKVTWLRHPATYVVAAAACAAAIAAPFVLDLGDGDPSPAPPSTSQTPTPSETLPPQEDVGGDWPMHYGPDRADLDGDGTPDLLRLRAEPGKPLIGPRIRVEAELSSTGDLVFGIIDSGKVSASVESTPDLDGDGDHELAVYRTDLPFAILDLVDGQLVELAAPSSPVLFTGIIDDPDTGRGYQSLAWGDREGLHSYITTDTYSGVEPLNLPVLYAVQVTSWSIADGALVASDEGVQCIDVVNGPPSGRPVSCPEDFGPGATPALFPEQQEKIGVGESFDVALGSVTFTVGLEADGSELVVDVPGGGEKRVALPDGEAPEVYTTPVNMSGASDLAVLVAQQGPVGTEMTLVVVRQGRLMATLNEGSVPFGNGQPSVDAGRFQTWIGPDNALYTALATIENDEEYEVYRWALGGTVSIDGTPTLQPQEVGCFRIADTAPDGAAVPCA